MAANESLVAEIGTRGLRKATKLTGLDRKDNSRDSPWKQGEGFNAREGGDRITNSGLRTRKTLRPVNF